MAERSQVRGGKLRLMRAVRTLLIGACVLAVTFVLWWGLSVGLSLLVGRGYAGLIALVIIVMAGWVANALLLWSQARRERSPPR